MNCTRTGFVLFFLLSGFCGFGQFQSLTNSILSSDTINLNASREKLFIHRDRPYYNINDTMWLKGYIVSAADHLPYDSSGIVYMEYFNATGELVQRTAAYAVQGMFASRITLKKSLFPQGYYLLRAYTQYMRNFGDSLFYESRFRVVDPADIGWRVNMRKLSVDKQKLSLTSVFQLPANDEKRLQAVTVVLRGKRKKVAELTYALGNSGELQVDSLFPAGKLDNVSSVEFLAGTQSLARIPVNGQIDDDIDLQFLPEGGTWLADQEQWIAFKAINSQGRGVAVSGYIENDLGERVAPFSSLHNGMGKVRLRPVSGRSYRAVLPDNSTVALPVVQRSGSRLAVINDPASDSIHIIIDVTPDLRNTTFLLRASTKGISSALGTVRVRDTAYKFSIARNVFPSGVSRITLYNQQELPVNERTFFVLHPDTSKITFIANKEEFSTRDSVHLTTLITNAKGEPVMGHFSVAVVDTSFITYPRHTENIRSYFLLSSDLTGHVEYPAYYLSDSAAGAADVLMLTQGWVNYNNFAAKRTFTFQKQFEITGRVTNLLNKPVPGSAITIFGKNGRENPFFRQAVTDANGRFKVSDFPIFESDTLSMLLKGVNKRGKSMGIGLEADEPVYPAAPSRLQAVSLASVINDTVTERLRQSVARYRDIRFGKEYLQEVVVTGRRKIAGSKNLNKDGASDQVIAQQTLDKAPKATLLDILLQEVKGFHRGMSGRFSIYKENTSIVVFYIDGYNIHLNYPPMFSGSYADYEESFLKYIRAEDVVGVEIMRNGPGHQEYDRLIPQPRNPYITYVFYEITTHSGHGAFLKDVPGHYLLKPVPPVAVRDFYTPRYAPSQPTDLPDYRNTLYWNPELVTDEKGMGSFSFPTSDNAGGFLVIVQGTDFRGGFITGRWSGRVTK